MSGTAGSATTASAASPPPTAPGQAGSSSTLPGPSIDKGKEAASHLNKSRNSSAIPSRSGSPTPSSCSGAGSDLEQDEFGNIVARPVPPKEKGKDGSDAKSGSSVRTGDKVVAAMEQHSALVAKKAADKQDREKKANIIWPTQARRKEFLEATGRNPHEEPQLQIAHLLNILEWKLEYEKYMTMPQGQGTTQQLSLLRKMAIELCLTKAKKKERNLAKIEEDRQRREREKASKEKGGSRSFHPVGGAAGQPSASASHRNQLQLQKRNRSPSSTGSSGSNRPGAAKQQVGDGGKAIPKKSAKDRLGAIPVKNRLGQGGSGQSQADKNQRRVAEMERGTYDIRYPINDQVSDWSEDKEKDDRLELDLDEADRFGDDEEDEKELDDGDRDHRRLSQPKERPVNNKAATQVEPPSLLGGKGPSYAKAVTRPAGEFRIIVQAGSDGGIAVTDAMWKKFRDRFNGLVAKQQDDLSQDPIRIDEIWFFGGRIIIEPADKESQTAIISLVAQIQVHSHSFCCALSTNLPPTAVAVFRIECQGDVNELITSERRGIIRLNKWKDLGPTPLRVISAEDNKSTSGSRFVRVAVTEPVITAIKKQNGVVYLGPGRSSVHYKNQPLGAETEVTFERQ